jgi:hypothetical protein
MPIFRAPIASYGGKTCELSPAIIVSVAAAAQSRPGVGDIFAITKFRFNPVFGNLLVRSTIP